MAIQLVPHVPNPKYLLVARAHVGSSSTLLSCAAFRLCAAPRLRAPPSACAGSRSRMCSNSRMHLSRVSRGAPCDGQCLAVARSREAAVVGPPPQTMTTRQRGALALGARCRGDDVTEATCGSGGRGPRARETVRDQSCEAGARLEHFACATRRQIKRSATHTTRARGERRSRGGGGGRAPRARARTRDEG